MEDYKLKYLKYKKKYLNLKSKVGGADLTYDEQLKLALALSNAGDEVVPQGRAKKSLAEKQAESRARAEKAADDELQRVLRESAAEAERQMRASVPVSAVAPVVPQGKAKKSLAERQAESRARAERAADAELQKVIALSEAEASRRQKRDIGAAAEAPNAFDLPLAIYNPNAVILTNQTQYSSEEGKSACTVICTEVANWILENGRVPNVDEIPTIMDEGLKIYQANFRNHTSFDQPLTSVYQKDLSYELVQSVGTYQEMNYYYERAPVENRIICVGITKPPESILVCFFPDGKIIIFDSHGRPRFGLNGAYILEFTSVNDTINYLKVLLPKAEPELLKEMPQLEHIYNTYSMFVMRKK